MTALASAPAPVPVVVRPVPWPRLAWVVWRRYRPVLVGVAVVVGLTAVYLFISGHRLRSAYSGVESCAPLGHGAPVSSQCQFQWMNFVDRYGDPGFVGPFLLLLPGLIGAFVGAPLLGRELETGVFRYSWTQGVGKVRLAVAMIVPAAVVLPLLMMALGQLVLWHDQPLFDNSVRHRLDPSVFPTTGPAVAGWTLVGLLTGVVAGLLWRRVVPAIATCFAIWFGLAFLASWLRLEHPAPLTTTARDLAPQDIGLDVWWTKDGARVSDAELNKVLAALGVQVDGSSMHAEAGGGGQNPIQYLQDHGYAQVNSYQPDSRYWSFQWIELGWLLVLSLALFAFTLWWLRRRSV